jgi:hypothetical protein
VKLKTSPGTVAKCKLNSRCLFLPLYNEARNWPASDFAPAMRQLNLPGMVRICGTGDAQQLHSPFCSVRTRLKSTICLFLTTQFLIACFLILFLSIPLFRNRVSSPADERYSPDDHNGIVTPRASLDQIGQRAGNARAGR